MLPKYPPTNKQRKRGQSPQNELTDLGQDTSERQKRGTIISLQLKSR